jgi:hypothetical protein
MGWEIRWNFLKKLVGNYKLLNCIKLYKIILKILPKSSIIIVEKEDKENYIKSTG